MAPTWSCPVSTDDLPEPDWATGSDERDPCGPYRSRLEKATSTAAIVELVESLLRALGRVNAGGVSTGSKAELASATNAAFHKLVESAPGRALDLADQLVRTEGKQPAAIRPVSPAAWRRAARRAVDQRSSQ